MNAVYHANSSMHKWGGQMTDYLPLHEAMDSSKSAFPDMRHRAILHHSFGIYVVAEMFGPVFSVTGMHGERSVPTRLILERHVIEDLGMIPTLSDYLGNMRLQPWMAGAIKDGKTKQIQAMPTMEEILERFRRSGANPDTSQDPINGHGQEDQGEAREVP